MIYVIYIALIIVSFLINLNGYLRGANKNQVDAVLSLLLIALIIGSFFVADWKFGVGAILITFFSSPILNPMAARIASKLFSINDSRKGKYIGLPSRHLKNISEQLGKPVNLNRFTEEMLNPANRIARANAEEALLDYCEQRPEIKKLLHDLGVSRDDLRKLYEQLITVGAGQWRCGHWVAASALAYPNSLRYILDKNKQVESQDNMADNLLMHFERGYSLEN